MINGLSIFPWYEEECTYTFSGFWRTAIKLNENGGGDNSPRMFITRADGLGMFLSAASTYCGPIEWLGSPRMGLSTW